MERTETGLKKAIDLIRSLKDDFYRNVKVLGTAESLNQSLEKAGRVADFFELGELMCIDALNRRESCGGHFRGESQTEDGEALRHDDGYRLRRRVGVGRRRGRPRPAQGRPRLHRHRDEAAELQMSMNADPEDLAPARHGDRRCDAHLPGLRRVPRHVVPGDARRAQRAAQRPGRGPDRVRLRLSRGHLRHVRPDDQRRRARPGGHHDLPAPHALVQRRRDDHHRAVALRRLPGAQGPRRRPQRLRPDHPAGRLHLGQHRLGARGPLGARPRATTRCAPSTSPPASAAAPASRRAPKSWPATATSGQTSAKAA